MSGLSNIRLVHRRQIDRILHETDTGTKFIYLTIVLIVFYRQVGKTGGHNLFPSTAFPTQILKLNPYGAQLQQTILDSLQILLEEHSKGGFLMNALPVIVSNY